MWKKTLALTYDLASLITGCGGLVLKEAAKGQPVRIIVFSKEKKEERGILKVFGLNDVRFLGFKEVPLSGAIVDILRREVEDFRPSNVLLPSPFLPEKNLLRVTRVFLKALEGRFSGELLFYEVTPVSFVNAVEDVGEFSEKKLELLSKLGSNLTLAETLMKLRGSQYGRQFGEAFLKYRWNGEKERFFENYPLVSVILRSNNMFFLNLSLESLLKQTYDFLECIIVWHGKDELIVPERWSILDYQVVEGVESRGKNLNLGVERASGDYLCFLDQDDVFYPEHVETLLSHAVSSGYEVTFSGCRAVRCGFKRDRVAVLKEERVFPGKYEKGRLFLENYIPLISALFRKHIFSSFRFNEDLKAYEDWLFLAQLESSGRSFSGIGGITCEYRIFGKSLESLHEKKGYTEERKAVFDIISSFIKGEDLKNLSDYLSLLRESFERKLEFYREEWGFRRKVMDRIEEFEEFLELTGAASLEDLLNETLRDGLSISVVVSFKDPPEDLFRRALESLAEQTYRNFEVCIVDDGSSKDLSHILKEIFSGAVPYKFKRLFRSLGISKAYNLASSMAEGDYIVFLDHDDRLDKNALLYVAAAVKDKNWDIVYTDSAIVDPEGKAVLVLIKPDWSPERLLSYNYINHLVAVKKSFFEDIGMFNSSYDGAQDWEFLLRASAKTSRVYHIKKVLYFWQSRKGSMAYRASEKPYALEASKRVVKDFLSKIYGGGVEVLPNDKGPGYVFRVSLGEEPIDVVILTQKSRKLFETCIKGLLRDTDYNNIKLYVMDGGGYAEKVLSNFNGFDFHVEKAGEDFNWSSFNNYLASLGSSPYILFLNDDVEIIDPGWLSAMLKYLAIDGVSCVGALLFFPNGKVQHNGIATDELLVAYEIRDFGERGELSMSRNVSAVTGACMLTKRKFFEDVCGFDENLAVSYNDVDFCLKLRKRGLRIVQSTDARLIHHQAATRGVLDTPEKRKTWKKEKEYMIKKWGDFLRERYHVRYKFSEPPHIILNF